MEKQINEMAQDIAKVFSDVNNGCSYTDCEICMYRSLENCKSYAIAERLDALGYRKQEEAEWLYNNGHGYYEPSYYCSWCYYGTDYKHLFCPCCGRKMKGE